MCAQMDAEWMDGLKSKKWMDAGGELVWDFKMLYFFIKKQGFSDQLHHRSSFFISTFSYWNNVISSCAMAECVYAWFPNCVFQNLCFQLNVCIVLLYLSDSLIWHKTIEPQHVNKPVSSSEYWKLCQVRQ